MNQLQDIKKQYSRNNIRHFYKGVRNYKQGYQASHQQQKWKASSRQDTSHRDGENILQNY